MSSLAVHASGGGIRKYCTVEKSCILLFLSLNGVPVLYRYLYLLILYHNSQAFERQCLSCGA
jgi:hypothetical protein